MTSTSAVASGWDRSRGVAERQPLVLIALGVILMSTGAVMVAATSTNGAVLSFWRLWIGVAVIGSLAVGHIRLTGRRPDRIGWMWAIRGGMVFGVHQLMAFIAIKTTSVVDVALMQVLVPVFVGVLATIHFGERPGLAFRLWSLVAIAGAAVVVLAGASGPEGNPGGVALAGASMVFFALYIVWSKKGRDHIDTVPFLFGVIFSAAVVVSLYVVLTGQPVGSIGRDDLLLAGAIAVIPGALAHFVTVWPLDRVPANIPPVMQLAMPFIAGALAWLLLDQPITIVDLIGGGISVAGVVGAILTAAGRQAITPGPDPLVIPAE